MTGSSSQTILWLETAIHATVKPQVQDAQKLARPDALITHWRGRPTEIPGVIYEIDADGKNEVPVKTAILQVPGVYRRVCSPIYAN